MMNYYALPSAPRMQKQGIAISSMLQCERPRHNHFVQHIQQSSASWEIKAIKCVRMPRQRTFVTPMLLGSWCSSVSRFLIYLCRRRRVDDDEDGRRQDSRIGTPKSFSNESVSLLARPPADDAMSWWCIEIPTRDVQ